MPKLIVWAMRCGQSAERPGDGFDLTACLRLGDERQRHHDRVLRDPRLLDEEERVEDDRLGEGVARIDWTMIFVDAPDSSDRLRRFHADDPDRDRCPSAAKPT
jgi:hypothetical protein